jgi:hypothetical protein
MVFIGLEKFDKMVLITQKEIREGSTAPLGTISFFYESGGPHSVVPEAVNYRYYQTVYRDWKKRQADLKRMQRDQVALASLLADRGEEPKLERQTHTLPSTPPVLAHVDDLSLPFQQLYQAEAVEGDVIAYAEISPYRSRYGCYSIHTRFDKVKPGGTMGRRQTERARLLRDRLVSLVKEQFHTCGWRIATDEESECWRWEGQAIIEQEQQLAHLALKTWRGSAEWRGNEKVVDLPEDLSQASTVRPKVFHPVPENETLEYLINPDEGLLRVRRRIRVPTPEEQQRRPITRVLGIIGDEEARERGAAPAYHRTISTRKVTFTCQGCKQTVTQERLPGPTPRYCSNTCQSESRRQKTLERVHRLRERQW